MDANNNHNNKVNDFPEAPASWNTRYVDPNGFECQITLRGDSGSELLEKATNAIDYLLKNGCIPFTYYRNGIRQPENKTDESKKNEEQNNGKDNPSLCPIHKVAMRKWEKDGRVWYSHKTDNGWCNGK
jgi:hypothetical protein